MTATNPHAAWHGILSRFGATAANMADELARIDRMLAAWVAAVEAAHQPRWLFLTPPLAVSLLNLWKPWWSVVRNLRTGNRHVGFGALLLAVSVVIPGRDDPCSR